MKRAFLLAITLTTIGCVRPGDHPISPNCVWTEPETRSLNLERAADRRHLRDDAVTAEDMAIRWADKYYGHRPEYDDRCAECMESIFQGLATHHAVNIALVRQYRLQRDPVFDSAVMLGFGLFYAAVAYGIAGLIRRRFPRDEWIGFWIMTACMSLGVSVVGLAVGGFWSILLETLRLNSAHLSYRMNRIPARQYWPALLFCCFVVFWLAAIIRVNVSAPFRLRRRTS